MENFRNTVRVQFDMLDFWWKDIPHEKYEYRYCSQSKLIRRCAETLSGVAERVRYFSNSVQSGR